MERSGRVEEFQWRFRSGRRLERSWDMEGKTFEGSVYSTSVLVNASEGHGDEIATCDFARA